LSTGSTYDKKPLAKLVEGLSTSDSTLVTQPLELNDLGWSPPRQGRGCEALNAGIHLSSKLNLTLLAEFAAPDLFDIEHVEVEEGNCNLGNVPAIGYFFGATQNREESLALLLENQQHLVHRRLGLLSRPKFVERIRPHLPNRSGPRLILIGLGLDSAGLRDNVPPIDESIGTESDITSVSECMMSPPTTGSSMWSLPSGT
jgi:hypothetical protein